MGMGTGTRRRTGTNVFTGGLSTSSIAHLSYVKRHVVDWPILRCRRGDQGAVILRAMTTLAFNHEEIVARDLKPSLFELDGISREAVEAHYKLYEGYVAKRNEILSKLGGVDLSAANQVYSEIRALIGTLIRRDFGSVDAWRADLKASGMAGRGWAWTAYDWDEQRLFNYVGDTQNTYPIWNAAPLVALDVYEHAYFLDYRTDRASYIDAFFNNLDWDIVNDWVSKYGIQP